MEERHEELSLDLGVVMVGAWDIVNKGQEPQHAPGGRIVIHTDGTFDLQSGSFAAAGEGSALEATGCRHLPIPQTYELVGKRLVLFNHDNCDDNGGCAHNVAAVQALELEGDRIVFFGQGGCRAAGFSRASILTRVTGATTTTTTVPAAP